MLECLTKINWKKVGLFASGTLFGTAGIKVLASDDAKKVYTNCTAAVLRAKETVMNTVTTVQENAEDIYEGAKQINEERAEAKAAAEFAEEAEAAEEETTEEVEAEAEAPAPNPYEKPAYTLDQIREFKEKEDTSQLLFVVEQYIGKPLTPTEMKTILFFTDRLHFSEDLIDYLIQYCVEKGKKDFRYIEKVAVSWAEEGITSPKQAARAARKYDKTVYDIMKALGKSSNPTKAEADYVIKWTKAFSFTQDIILEACERTVMATDKHRFEYADSILNNWHKNEVHHKADILKLDDAYSQSRQTSAKSVRNTTASFNQMMRSTYDFDALEKEIISN